MEHIAALPPRIQLSNTVHEIFIEINRLIRGYINTTLFKIGNQNSKVAINANLERIAQELRDLLIQFYSDDIGDQIKADFLNFVDHMKQLIEAYANGDENAVIRNRNDLYYLANTYAHNYALTNRYINRQTLQSLFYAFINSVENQVVSILNQDYAKDIEEYGVMNDVGYRLADEITYGILRQFYSGDTQ